MATVFGFLVTVFLACIAVVIVAGFVFVPLGIALIVWWAVRAARTEAVTTGVAWLAAAATLGLDFTPRTLFVLGYITGEIDGNVVRVEPISQTVTDRYRTRCIRYSVHYPGTGGAGFVATVGTWPFGVKLGRAGVQVVTGDLEFDHWVTVRSQDPESIADFLSSERRRAMRWAFAGCSGGVISDTEAVLEFAGTEHDAEQLVSRVRALVALADVL